MVMTHDTLEQAALLMAEIADSFDAAQAAVAARIRGIYDGSVTTP